MIGSRGRMWPTAALKLSSTLSSRNLGERFSEGRSRFPFGKHFRSYNDRQFPSDFVFPFYS